MLRIKHIIIGLLASGISLFYAACQLYDWRILSVDGFYKLCALGLLCWAIRFRITTICAFDKLIANIAMWLCIFNVYDEFIALNSAKPYKPYIASLIIIISSAYIYARQCRKQTKT